MIYRMQLADSVDEMTFDLLEVPIEDKDIEGTADNTTIDGNVFTDYLWLKKQFVQKWSLMCEDDYTQLRGFYTRQWENAEVPTYKLFVGENRSETLTASGSAFQIQNGTQYDAPFTLTEITGNATQTTYSGKNLADLVPMATATITSVNYATAEIVNDATLNRQVLHMTATGGYPTALYTFPQRLESGKYYSMTIKYRSSYTGTQPNYYKEMWIAPNWFGNNWDTLNSFANGRGKNQDGVSGAKIQQSTAWTTATFRFYIDPAQYANVADSYKRLNISMGQGIVSGTTAKEMWIADIMLAEITQAQWDATTYKDEDFEPYVGGTASPNPDYPQPISTTTGENVVKIMGKNILPTITGSDTYSGVSLTSNNGTITATGTASASMTFTLTGSDGIKYRQMYWQTILATTTNSVLIPKGTYYFSGTATLDNISIQYRIVDIGQKLEDGTSISLNTSITLTEAKWLCITIYVNNTRTPTVNMSALQLELGSTATAYEPYQGQSYEVNLGGTNLVNQSELMAGYVQSNGYPTVSQTQAEMRTDYLKVEPNTTYTFSIQETTDTYSSWFGWCEYTGQTPTTVIGTRQVVGSNPATFTTSATAKYVILSARNLQHATKVQLQKGSIATHYEPFVTYTYELAKIGTYQDRIYKNDGKWYIEKQVGKADLATLTWTGTPLHSTTSITDIKYTSTNTELGAILAEKYTPHIGSGMSSATGCIAVDVNAVRVNDANAPSGLAYYALATPTTTEITDSTLLSQLNFIANLYGGTNNIMLVGTGAQGEIGVEYALTYEKEQVIIPETPVRLNLTDGGVINTCGCRQNVQLTMRETVQ